MCGRYAQALDTTQVQRAIVNYHQIVNEVRGQELQHPSYNIGPSNVAPVYRITENGDHVIQYMKWGLVPIWTKKQSEANHYKTFNARKESIMDGNRVWKAVRNKKRVVVPIQGYYEWLHKPIGNSKKVDKIPYYIKRKDDKLMFLAGMYSVVQFEDTKEKLYTFTIITGNAPKQLKWLHDRMPVVLTPGTVEWDRWLGNEEWTDDLGREALKEYNEEDLEWYEVTRDVGKVSNDGEYLVKPVQKKKNDIGSFFGPKNEAKKEDVKKEEDPEETKSSVKKQADIKPETDLKEHTDEKDTERKETDVKVEEEKKTIIPGIKRKPDKQRTNEGSNKRRKS